VSYLLDTNILSAHLRRPLTHRFVQYSGRLFTSSLCLGELYVWVFGRKDVRKTLAALDQLLEFEVTEIPFDHACGEHFGKKRFELRQQGIEVGTVDLMIAAVALHHDLTLVTHNTSDFRNVASLRLEDWLKP
jgi:tRNA(fMet)-specific endonuclease VapC